MGSTDLAVRRAPISETFTSIQGEGALSGTPSYFIRFSGCNLRCRWCDTAYASWSPEGEKRLLRELVDEAVASGAGHVVITGGEPMLFDEVEPLSMALREKGLHITIETAGTIHRSPDRLACDLLSVSPKLTNSTPIEGDARDPDGKWRRLHELRRLPVDVMQRLIDDYPKRQIKFVVCEASDLAEIDELLGKLTGWNPEEVFLMPEGVGAPSVETVAWVGSVCEERGWRYGHRLHIELFGNVRGT